MTKRFAIWMMIFFITFCTCMRIKNPINIVEEYEITISPESITKRIGSTIQYEIQILDLQYETHTDITPIWYSTDTTIVSINQTGLATCKNVGQTEIYAAIDTFSSNHSIITVISPYILAGQKTSNGIYYLDLEPNLISCYHQYIAIDLDKDNKADYYLLHEQFGGNNAEIMDYITPYNNNLLCVNDHYKTIADSIFTHENDSLFNDPYPDHLELYSIQYGWVEPLQENQLIDDCLSWCNNTAAFAYRYKSDAKGYYSPDYGLWKSGNENYVGLEINTDNGYIYGWMKVKISKYGDENILILEYAIKDENL